MIAAWNLPCWPGPAPIPTPSLTGQAWLDWAVLDYRYQVEIFNAWAALAASRREAGAPPVVPEEIAQSVGTDRLPNDKIPSEGARRS